MKGAKHLDKPRQGRRRVFFHRLWCRIHGLPIYDKGAIKGMKKRYLQLELQAWKKKSKDDVDDGSDSEEEDSQDVDETPSFSDLQYGEYFRLSPKLAKNYPELAFSPDSPLKDVNGFPL